MNLIYHKWDEVPISVYREISGIVEAEGVDDTTKSVQLLAALCGVPEGEIWDLTLPEISALSKQIEWVYSFDFDKKKKPHRLKIAGNDYVVNYEVAKMSIAAYVDFQTYFKDRDKYMGAILTTFVLPKGKKYAEDYDCVELAKTFEAEVPITTYNTLLYFFLLTSLNSIRAMQIYSELALKEVERKTGKTLTQARAKLRKIADTFGLPSLTK